MEAIIIADEGVLNLPLLQRRSFHMVYCTCWPPHHLQPLHRKRSSPVGTTPKQGAFLIGWCWETSIVLIKTGGCSWGALGYQVIWVVKLPSERIHGPLALAIHNILGIEHRFKPLHGVDASWYGFSSNISELRGPCRGGGHRPPCHLAGWGSRITNRADQPI